MKTKLTTIGPDFLKELRWTVDQVRRMVRGNISDAPPDIPQAPDDVVLWTPSGGIAARSGATVTGALCDTYRIVDSDPDDNEVTLEAILDGNSAAVQVKAFNLSNAAVGGSRYVVSSRLRSGHRHIVVESCDAEA